jgi:hypothetical protein
MMIPLNNIHQPVWHLWYVDTAVEGSELYYYNNIVKWDEEEW